jgi:hypothetical protein
VLPARPAAIAPRLRWVFKGSGDLPRCALPRWWLGNAGCREPASSDRLPVHRSESPTGYSSAGCSPAEPASASPVLTILAQSRSGVRCSTSLQGCSSTPRPRLALMPPRARRVRRQPECHLYFAPAGVISILRRHAGMRGSGGPAVGRSLAKIKRDIWPEGSMMRLPADHEGKPNPSNSAAFHDAGEVPSGLDNGPILDSLSRIASGSRTDLTPSPTARRAQAGSDARAQRSRKKGARVVRMIAVVDPGPDDLRRRARQLPDAGMQALTVPSAPRCLVMRFSLDCASRQVQGRE